MQGTTILASAVADVSGVDIPLVYTGTGGGGTPELKIVSLKGGSIPTIDARPSTWVTTWTPQTVLATVCNGVEDRYRFGFNGQEKVNEVAGLGNHNTALFWEYDTRLARRWNLDPKPTESESQYSVMHGNPIANDDINGDQSPFGYMGLPRAVWESAGARQPYNQEEAWNWALWVPKEMTKDIGLIALATMPIDEFAAAGGAALLERLAPGASKIFRFGAVEAKVYRTTKDGAEIVQAEIRVIKAEENVTNTSANVANTSGGRGSNNRTPDTKAVGDHSVFNDRGNTTYKVNEKNPSGFDEVKRTDTKGKAHTNSDGTKVETPHVHEKGKKDVRPAVKGKDY